MFQTALAEAAKQAEACLIGAIDALPPGNVRDGMRWAATGGKRLRAFLVLESARLHGVQPDQALPAAAAIEAMHAYSLVHDDLPCMDDDDLRRGRPTVHVRWDEATGVLVGDALQSLSFDLVSQAGDADHPARRVRLISELAVAAGAGGMVLGQAQDIAAETAPAPLNLTEITTLQSNKTGALIRWSAMAGPVMAGADPNPMQSYATALGLAFQIADDILDVTGDSAKMGKKLGKDSGAGKATFVSLLGLDGARKRADDLIDEAEAALAPYGDEGERLRQAARFVVSRET